jgi:hypothetical protein
MKTVGLLDKYKTSEDCSPPALFKKRFLTRRVRMADRGTVCVI